MQTNRLCTACSILPCICHSICTVSHAFIVCIGHNMEYPWVRTPGPTPHVVAVHIPARDGLLCALVRTSAPVREWQSAAGTYETVHAAPFCGDGDVRMGLVGASAVSQDVGQVSEGPPALWALYRNRGLRFCTGRHRDPR